MKKGIIIFAIISLIAAWILGKVLYEPPDYMEKIETLFQEDGQVEYVLNNTNPLVYEVYTVSQESFLGYVTVAGSSGYEGNVYTATRICPEGTVIDAIIVEENEWRHWIQKIEDEKYFEQFKLKNITDPFYLGHDLDGVTRATITSHAIAGGIRQGTHFVASTYFQLEPVKISEPWFAYKLLLIPALWLMIVAAVVMKYNRLRWVTLILGIVLVGFMFNSNVSISHIGAIMVGNFPAISNNFTWYVMIFGIILTTFILGKNVYCYWLCPFGAIQEVLHLASGKRLSPGKRVKQILMNIRKTLVWLVLIIILLTQAPSTGGYEPFATMFAFTGNTLQWAIIFYTLIVGIISYRFWCHNLCPVGYCINLFADISRQVKSMVRDVVDKEQTISSKVKSQEKGGYPNEQRTKL